MRRFLGLFLIAMGLVVGISGGGQSAYAAGKWTFMVYISDCDLEAAGINDFLEMAGVGSGSELNILVQFDRIEGYDSQYGDWTTCKRFRVMQGMTPTPENALQDIGEVNSGDPAVLEDFVQWGVSNYPAEKYALVLWNHGGGWRKKLESGISNFKAVCWDDTTGEKGDPLYTRELEAALNQMDTQPDLIGFDACLMGMMEVAYQIRNTGAKVMVASEAIEPASGWPYTDLLYRLYNNKDWTAAQLGTAIVDEYYLAYEGQTQSAIDLSEVGVLADSVSELANTLSASWNTDQQAVRDAARLTMNRTESAVIHEKHGTDSQGSNGIAIYFPRSIDLWNAEYDGENIAFAADTPWEEFLSDFYRSMSGSYVDIARKIAMEYDGGWDRDHIDLYDFCSWLDTQADISPGYTVQNSGDHFNDISQTGTLQNIGDELYHRIAPEGFAFDYYGSSHTAFSISDNGVIYFQDGVEPDAYSNQTIPGVRTFGEVFIAPLWADYNGAQVYWTVAGTGSEKRLIVQWQQATPYGNEVTTGGTFQAVLYENGKMVFHYPDIDFGAPLWNNGASATVGVQGSVTRGLEYSHNTPAIDNGTALLFHPDDLQACTYRLSSDKRVFSAEGGSAMVSIAADAGCEWSAGSDVGWATITEGHSGTGNGTVYYTVEQNTDLDTRTGTLTLAGQTLTLNQESPCSYEMSPAEQYFPGSGGTGTIEISTGLPGCPWTVQSRSDWIKITSSASGEGAGTVAYAVSGNPGTGDRAGKITIAGRRFTVTQQGADNPKVAVLENNVTVKDISLQLGSSRYFRLEVPAEATDLQVRTWGGTGDSILYLRHGQVPTKEAYDDKEGLIFGNQAYSIVEAPRAGTWYLMLHSFESFDDVLLNAAYNTASCECNLSSFSKEFSAAGGTGSFNVMTGPDCIWSAWTPKPWIQLHNLAPVSGSKEVGFDVSFRALAPPRTGTIDVMGQTFVVNQFGESSSATALSNGTSQSDLSADTAEKLYFKIDVPADQKELIIQTGGGTGDFDIYAKHNQIPDFRDNDAKSADEGNMESIRIENPGAGVWYIMMYAYNAASGVTMNASYIDTVCTYAVSSEEIFLEGGGQTGTITVTAPEGCYWTAGSDDNWITIAGEASGSGEGTVSYSVAENASPFERTGTIGIADQSVRVTQDGNMEIHLLENGVPVSGQSVDSGTNLYYRIDVPEGQKNLLVDIWGGTGDADLYVGHNQIPVVADDSSTAEDSSYDHCCAFSGNNESIHVKSPPAGDYYILVLAYEPFSDLSVKAAYNSMDCGFSIEPTRQDIAASGQTASVSVTCDGSCPWTIQPLPSWIDITSEIHQQGSNVIDYEVASNDNAGIRVGNIRIADQWVNIAQAGTERTEPESLENEAVRQDLSADMHENRYYQITVPENQRILIIQTGQGSGDVDVHVAYGRLPNLVLKDFSSRSWGNTEQIEVIDPRPGTWYIMLFAYETYSGLSLQASYEAGGLFQVISILQMNAKIPPIGVPSPMALDYNSDGRIGVEDAISVLRDMAEIGITRTKRSVSMVPKPVKRKGLYEKPRIMPRQRQ